MQKTFDAGCGDFVSRMRPFCHANSNDKFQFPVNQDTMTNHATLSDDTTAKRLQRIREYVVLQKKLISKAVFRLDPAATEYDFEESLPPAITIDGTTWSTKAHGLGVMFLTPQSKTIVDVHVGFIDAPNAFDAWRLVQYCESKLGTNEDVTSWQSTLDELARDGRITLHERHERHYVLK